MKIGQGSEGRARLLAIELLAIDINLGFSSDPLSSSSRSEFAGDSKSSGLVILKNQGNIHGPAKRMTMTSEHRRSVLSSVQK